MTNSSGSNSAYLTVLSYKPKKAKNFHLPKGYVTTHGRPVSPPGRALSPKQQKLEMRDVMNDSDYHRIKSKVQTQTYQKDNLYYLE